MREALAEFSAVVATPSFPCTFATKALEEDALLFAQLLWSEQEGRVDDLDSCLGEYLAQIEEAPISVAPMMVLIIFVELPSSNYKASLEPVAWQILQALMDVGTSAHEPPVPIDSPSGSLGYRGTRLFVNVSSPQHIRRRSRNLGTRLTLVVQPRDGFELVAPMTSRGAKIRETIRRRVDIYDAIPRSPDLVMHGISDNRDWKQYWLVDDETGQTKSCPLVDPQPGGQRNG